MARPILPHRQEPGTRGERRVVHDLDARRPSSNGEQSAGSGRGDDDPRAMPADRHARPSRSETARPRRCRPGRRCPSALICVTATRPSRWPRPSWQRLDCARSSSRGRGSRWRSTPGKAVPVTLVAAPAGYGKTTAVRAWCAARRAAPAWVTLDGGDNDPVRLWSYAATAVERVHEGLGRDALQRLSSRRRLRRERRRRADERDRHLRRRGADRVRRHAGPGTTRSAWRRSTMR